MALALQLETPSYPQWNHHQTAHPASYPSACQPTQSVYAPTLSSTAEVKDQFYEKLDSCIKTIPVNEHLYLLGDFNARVGSDHDSWPSTLGHFGVGKMIENDQRLLELCSYYSLCIITKYCSLNTVLHTRSFHSADCDTDHSLVASKVHLQPEPYHRSKQKGHPRINTARTQIPSLYRDFATSIENALQGCHIGDAEKMWHHMHEAISNSALNIFGK